MDARCVHLPVLVALGRIFSVEFICSQIVGADLDKSRKKYGILDFFVLCNII